MARAERKAAAAASAVSGEMTHRQILLVLVGLMSGMFLAALDQNVVGAAMRTIADDLKGLELQAWVTTAYLITSTISTPLYGKLGDIFGRRRLFIIAISIFIVGSLLCGTATDMLQLAAWRAVQGIGAGGLFTLALTVLADIVPPRERARYQGMFLAVFGTSSVLGPVLGGAFAGANQILFVDGWRWVFLINLPIGLVAMFMVLNFLHVPHTAKNHRIDWWGAVAIALAVVPLLLVAENGRDWGWWSIESVVCYALSVLGIIWFIFAERAAKDEALLPLKMFKSSTFSLASIMGLIIGVGMFGGMMTVPLLLQIVMGASPTEAGFMMLPMVAGMMTATIVSGQVTSKTGRYKIFMILGPILLAFGYLWLTSFNPDTEYWQTAIGMVLMGMGLGQLMQTLVLAVQSSVPASEVGVATASATFFRQIGGSLGVAVFISILFNQLAETIPAAFKNADVQAGIKAALQDKAVLADPNNADFLKALQSGNMGDLVTKLNTDSSFLNHLDPRFARPFLMGFADAGVTVFWSAAIVVAVAVVIAIFIKAPKLRDKSAMQEAAQSAAH
ncbi:MDR family MFS transporter [Rhodoluna sp.]|uniref:MDR family MFS transporter n=1 Tax=Rhodoluna sp. TaxID=1969481 RepID=UPI0025DA5DB0|nr:MDR family MFS transporter [Rhodoluna sp.]